MWRGGDGRRQGHSDSGVMRRVLEYAKMVGLPYMAHCEDHDLQGRRDERGLHIDDARHSRHPEGLRRSLLRGHPARG